MNELKRIKLEGGLPINHVIQNLDEDLQEKQAKAAFMPILVSSAINKTIRSMDPIVMFSSVEGRKIFYNLFSLLEITDTWRSQNMRWKASDERGLLATRNMLEHLREGLQDTLKIEIPYGTIFKLEGEEDEEIQTPPENNAATTCGSVRA